MLKFLRKYKQWILVIGGAMLMVAFLLPQALQDLSHAMSGRSTYMRVNGARVSAKDAQLANQELYALHGIGLLPKSVGVEEWILRVREATAAGLVGSADDGKTVVDEMAQAQAIRYAQFARWQNQQDVDIAKITETAKTEIERQFAAAAGSAHMTLTDFYGALAKWKGFGRLEALYRAAPARVSDRRAANDGVRYLSEAKVDYVYINADRLTKRIPTPDDAALQALFEKYKNVKDGTGEHGVGYTLPPRVKVSWITLPRKDWERAVTIDPVEVRKRYLQANKDKPVSGAEFEAARQGIEETIRREALDKAIAQARNTVAGEITRSLLKVEKSGDFVVLPPDWDQKRPNFERIRDVVVDRVKAESGLSVSAPPVATKGEWQTRSDLVALPGIGVASARRGNSSVSFADMALGVKELAEKPSPGLQAGVPTGPIEDAEGNVYYFVVLDAKNESPPASWTEIRERLEKDAKRIEAFKLLESGAETYRLRAVASGLENIANDSELKDFTAEGANQLPRLARDQSVTRQGYLPPEIDTEGFRTGVIDAADKLDPAKPMSQIDVAHRTIAVPLKEKLALAVVRINALTPMTVERYRVVDTALSRNAMTEAFKDRKDDPFSMNRYRERFKIEGDPESEKNKNKPKSGEEPSEG